MSKDDQFIAKLSEYFHITDELDDPWKYDFPLDGGHPTLSRRVGDVDVVMNLDNGEVKFKTSSSTLEANVMHRDFAVWCARMLTPIPTCECRDCAAA